MRYNETRGGGDKRFMCEAAKTACRGELKAYSRSGGYQCLKSGECHYFCNAHASWKTCQWLLDKITSGQVQNTVTLQQNLSFLKNFYISYRYIIIHSNVKATATQ